MAEQKSYLQEIIAKRKEYLANSREENNDSKMSKVLSKLSDGIAMLGDKPAPTAAKKLTANSLKTGEIPVRQSTLNSPVQEKLLKVNSEQSVTSKLTLDQVRISNQADRSEHSSDSSRAALSQRINEVDAFHKQTILQAILDQLKKLTDAVKAGGGGGEPSLIDTALDFLSRRKRRGGGRPRGGRPRPSTRPRPRPSTRPKAMGAERTRGQGGRGGVRPSSARPPTPVPRSGIRGMFTTAAEKLKAFASPVTNRLAPTLGQITTPLRTAGSTIVNRAPDFLKSGVNKLGGVGKLATPLALGAGAVDIGSELMSDKPALEKAQGVAKSGSRMAGGFLGAEAGAMAGGALGAFGGPLAPVTVPLGALAGGVAGSIVGAEGIEKLTTSLSEAITESGLGEAVGRTAAIVMSPFSEDARNALVQDYKRTIAPTLARPFNQLSATMAGVSETTASLSKDMSDYTDALEEGGSAIFRSVSQAGSTMWEGIKKSAKEIWEGPKEAAGVIADEVSAGASKAVGQVSAGYQQGGLTGAAQALPGAAGEVIGSIGSAGGKAASVGGSALGKAGGQLGSAASQAGGELQAGVDEARTAMVPKGKAFVGWAQEKIKEEYVKRGVSPEQADVFSKGAAAQMVNEVGWQGKKTVGKNNFFNIKETAKQKGDVEGTSAIDKAERASGKGSKGGLDMYSGYSTPEKGVSAYVDFLQNNPRYKKAGVFEAKTTAEYGEALKRGGFATDPNYAQKIASTASGSGMKGAMSEYQEFKKNNPIAPETQVAKVEDKLKGGPTQIASNDVITSAKAPALTPQTFVEQQAAPVAKTETAVGRQAPIVIASSKLPGETQSVNVMNQIPPVEQKADKGGSQIPTQSASVELGEIPIRIDDFGLILISIGHV